MPSFMKKYREKKKKKEKKLLEELATVCFDMTDPLQSTNDRQESMKKFLIISKEIKNLWYFI